MPHMRRHPRENRQNIFYAHFLGQQALPVSEMQAELSLLSGISVSALELIELATKFTTKSIGFISTKAIMGQVLKCGSYSQPPITSGARFCLTRVRFGHV